MSFAGTKVPLLFQQVYRNIYEGDISLTGHLRFILLKHLTSRMSFAEKDRIGGSFKGNITTRVFQKFIPRLYRPVFYFLLTPVTTFS